MLDRFHEKILKIVFITPTTCSKSLTPGNINVLFGVLQDFFKKKINFFIFISSFHFKFHPSKKDERLSSYTQVICMYRRRSFTLSFDFKDTLASSLLLFVTVS